MNGRIILMLLAFLVVVLGAVFALWPRAAREYSGKIESITIGYAPFESAALYYIAEDQHFFSKNGLNVTSRKYATGAAALGGILNGEADIAVGISEFPIVGSAFRKEDIRIMGSIDRADFIHLVGRKDRGIEKVSDLRGKRVGTTFGTVAHFHLGRLLNLHGMSLQDLTLVDVRTPEEWVSAVANGDIDAIVTAQPYAGLAKDRLGANAVVWPAQSGQPVQGLIIAPKEWITKHPELAERVLNALARAEEYLFRHPDGAKAALQKRLNLNPAYVETVWSQNQFSLSLDQALIMTMEDEARWMIANKLTGEKQIPDLMDYVYEDGLKAVKPGAVSVIR
jgi:NitT/TauT family transport system substrate-binding protein